MELSSVMELPLLGSNLNLPIQHSPLSSVPGVPPVSHFRYKGRMWELRWPTCLSTVSGRWGLHHYESFQNVNILKDGFVHHPWSRNHTKKGDMKNPRILFGWPRRTWNSASKKLKSFTFGCNDNGIFWKWQWTFCNEAKGPRKCFALRKPHVSTANLGFKLFLENLGRNTNDSFLHRLHATSIPTFPRLWPWLITPLQTSHIISNTPTYS